MFSLGTLLARLSLGRSPWGTDSASVVHAIRSGTPDLTGLPPALARIVRECLRADPAARPAPAQVTTALVPGADSGVVHPPRLTPQARDLVAEHTTLAATQRLPTLGYTRHADTTTLPPLIRLRVTDGVLGA